MFYQAKIFVFFYLLILLFTGCQNSEYHDAYTPQYSKNPPMLKKKVYIFGVHPLHNPQRLFQVYQPMVDYINERLDTAELRLEASRNYAEYDKKLYSGHFDFALPNPYQTVIAAKKAYKIFGKMGDDYNFRGIILVRKDSGINQVSDLKYKTISYPAPTALAATMMPQWYLHAHGLDINHDVKNIYVGSQESSIMNVYLKKSDAAATWPPPWKVFTKMHPEVAQKVMVKWETFSLPNNALVARNDVPDDMVRQVGEIIFSLHSNHQGSKILKTMELSKFEKAHYKTYDSVREFIKKFDTEVRSIRTNDDK